MRRNDYCAQHAVALPLLLAVASIFLFVNAFAATGDQKCAATKTKAAGKKFFAKAKCHQKAILKGTATDPACLAKAEEKFVASIAKADLLGLCPGTAVGIEAIVDDCLDALAGDITPAGFAVTSPTITEGGAIPTTHVCATVQGGMNQSPQLAWVDPPAGTMSFVMVLTDKTNALVHSVFYDIPSTLTGLPANVEAQYAPPSVTGMHTTNAYNGQRGWAGPCPSGEHTYEIAIYALDVPTPPGSTMATTKDQIVASITANTLGVAKLNATFMP